MSNLEDKLDSFDAAERRAALEGLAAVRGARAAVREEVNLHFHTFFSFNAMGWSPGRIAWEAVKYGLEAAGIVDFDVLDGMDEFLAAGDVLGLKTVVGLESRVFVRELADKVMSSPNEPGVAYFMGTGFYRNPERGSRAESLLADMGRIARVRNVELMGRVNDYLDEVRLDYGKDVLPLTPSGNATERHLLAAYDAKSREMLGEKAAAFWGEKLGLPVEEASELLANTVKFHDVMRSKLMKFGGVGYVPPESGSFPSVDDASYMIREMGAIPTATWLDGTNPGESDSRAFVELFRSKGSAALNIIPDRNWNLKNPEEKALKTKKLAEIVDAARDAGFPICVGTEMNKAGLPFVDDFNAPELAPFVKDFVYGARILWGHTVLARAGGLGYLSDWAEASFGDDVRKKNDFYLKAGSADAVKTRILVSLDGGASPSGILEMLS